MKRILLSVTATIAGLVALLGFKSHSPVTVAGGLPEASLPTTTPNPATGSAAGTSAGSGASSTPAARPSGSSAAPASTPPSATARSYTGTAVTTQYGIVQVRVDVVGKKITNVSFVQLTAFDGRSAQINSQAAPVLLQETLTAQSAHIDSVSGASYTSAGYVQSLQSALDQAGI
jgi:FMN-binding domain